MPFAAESAGRVALGKLRAMSPSVPTCAYTVRTPEYIVTARFYYGRPIVDITPIAGTSLTEEYSEDSVFVDSGVL